jgi:DNA-binding MarR family transcriptional regulator
VEALSQNAVRVLKMLRHNPQVYYGEIAKQLDMPIDQVARAVDEIVKAGRATIRTPKNLFHASGGAA